MVKVFVKKFKRIIILKHKNGYAAGGSIAGCVWVCGLVLGEGEDEFDAVVGAVGGVDVAAVELDGVADD